ncbi:hypothetical protein K466DRAFT_543238 [Polyporus arcularius HHB13444]|uniref:Amidohydrolase-related domain-containing protein n=1 Tax=Polyporus arcularius HHB13444 TaxID=1314778 RepID=A0A5C3PRY0_9APHY|nr:hypothetical protein K466DRAFT_543238 [Polyporus arcularius HHB13444]
MQPGDHKSRGHDSLPAPAPYTGPRRKPNSRRTLLGLFVLLATTSAIYISSGIFQVSLGDSAVVVPLDAQSTLAKCRSLQLKPGPPADFYSRTQSDRFQVGTASVLIRNAKIWTGNDSGREVLRGDIFLDKGIMKAVGHVPRDILDKYAAVTTIDAEGAWLTPGIVDLHSHLGGQASPALSGSNDGNSYKGPIVPWLRALDALNTHDDGYRDSMSGGVTTSLMLPGSLNGIAGQGLVMKLRPTKERSPTSMLLEPPLGINGTDVPPGATPRFGHMKHACGENPKYYQDTRMDTVWAVRHAYDTARTIKNAQDDYCEKVLSGDWRSLGSKKFPEDLQWQPLVDILRGRTKVQTHCYEAVDLDNFVRLSNEFQFEVAAFHHAHEAYLVPEVLKRAYNNTPAIAMFSTFARYKREGYRHSEFAPRVLADEGIDVVMKSDHFAIPSRNLIGEAAIAHHYGLSENVALASVISTPAKILGLDHRIGYVKEGYDADIVLWDSHPLALGATPTQVVIDGILQFPHAHIAAKPAAHQLAPTTPKWDVETARTLEYDGLPPLEPKFRPHMIVFTNVSQFWTRDEVQGTVVDMFATQGALDGRSTGFVVAVHGQVVCSGAATSCASYLSSSEATVVDLAGGAVQPGLVNYGAELGLSEIFTEASTRDGYVADPLQGQPSFFGPGGYVAKAIDGLQFGTRDALLAYRAGVTVSITSPSHNAWLSGISTAFSLGAPHKLSRGAILRDVVAVHVSLTHGDSEPSVSTKIEAMRRLLTKEVNGEIGAWFQQVANGTLPLVVNVHSANIIATLISLKKEVEAKTGNAIKLTIAGATEAHLLAAELAQANVGVIVTPSRSFPYNWDERRTLPGPPQTADSLIGYLIKHNITVGVGPRGIGAMGHPGVIDMANSRARNLRFDIGEAMLDAGPGLLDKASAFALASVNVEKLLGLNLAGEEQDLVATAGGDLLDYEGKVIAVISPRRGLVDVF